MCVCEHSATFSARLFLTCSCYAMSGWIAEVQIEPAFLLQLLLLFLLKPESGNSLYCRNDCAGQGSDGVFSCGPTDPESALERAAEDGEVGRLRKGLLSPEEGEEGEEEDEEPALHSCDSCRQVFESLSDLTEHKINQCQLTGKQRSAHRASPSTLPLSSSSTPTLFPCVFNREFSTPCVIVLHIFTPLTNTITLLGIKQQGHLHNILLH